MTRQGTKWPTPDAMRKALDVASEAAVKGEVPIGAVVMRGEEVLAVSFSMPFLAPSTHS